MQPPPQPPVTAAVQQALSQVFLDFGIQHVFVPEEQVLQLGGELAFVLRPQDYARVNEGELHMAVAEVITQTKIAIIRDSGMVPVRPLWPREGAD